MLQPAGSRERGAVPGVGVRFSGARALHTRTAPPAKTANATSAAARRARAGGVLTTRGSRSTRRAMSSRRSGTLRPSRRSNALLRSAIALLQQVPQTLPAPAEMDADGGRARSQNPGDLPGLVALVVVKDQRRPLAFRKRPERSEQRRRALRHLVPPIDLELERTPSPLHLAGGDPKGGGPQPRLRRAHGLAPAEALRERLGHRVARHLP